MRRAVVAAGVAALLCAACVRTHTSTVEVAPDPGESGELKTAANLPQQFTVAIPATAAGDCPPRLRDDGLGTVLVLQRSTLQAATDSAGGRYRAFGDYRAEPRGRYGEAAGEGLRVDCARLRALGIVTL